MSDHTPSRRTTRLIRTAVIGVGAVALLSLSLASPAAAHVTVHPSTIPAGSADIELTFRVPSERDDANTVGLQVFFPANLPLVTVDVRPIPGWTAKVDATTLSSPVRTDDGPVSQVVSDITWTATASGIAPGQYQDFDVAAGQIPSESGEVVFKSLQTYSSGEIVRWIQVASPQDPRPDSPAPVLTPTRTSAAPTPTASPTGVGSDGLAIAALAVAIAALAGVVVLFGRGRRPSPATPTGTPPDDGE
jgi:uncharacterized protein YcnI